MQGLSVQLHTAHPGLDGSRNVYWDERQLALLEYVDLGLIVNANELAWWDLPAKGIITHISMWSRGGFWAWSGLENESKVRKHDTFSILPGNLSLTIDFSNHRREE